MALQEMTSLEDIKGLVSQLRLKIIGSKSDVIPADWQRDWIKIKIAIDSYTGLSNADERKRLKNLIYEKLNNLRLEGTDPGPISVEREEEIVRKDSKAGETPKPAIIWLPY